MDRIEAMLSGARPLHTLRGISSINTNPDGTLTLGSGSSGNVVPDYSWGDLSEYGIYPQGGFPGAGSSDPAGIGGVNPIISDGNPNPTGDWGTTALQIARTALAAFAIYTAGSPSVATPPAQHPSTSIGRPGTVTIGGNSINVTTVLFAAAGVFILVAIAKKSGAF